MYLSKTYSLAVYDTLNIGQFKQHSFFHNKLLLLAFKILWLV